MVTTFVLAMVLQAQAPLEPAPGTDYDPSIPTLEQVVGHAPGEEVTPPEDLTRYLQALAEAAPERTNLIHYGDTWEGRPLHMLAIAGAANMARMDEIQAGLARLADPRGLSDGDADALIADLPTVVILMHGVHGNEISSSGAAVTEAYHLLAAQNDPRVDEILENVIVLVDPAQNPDGRARFVLHTTQGRAASPDSDPLSAEHDEPWPGGRTNHYLFDMNRDWFIQSQPETRGRMRVMNEWYPQVVVDLHEMGGNNTYFFPPVAPPVTPWIPPSQRAGWDLMGESIAEAFDERGFPYFNNENYDAFYPGYGDSWPGGHGAIAMTFEQASARGLVFEREDGTQLTYNRGVVQHFTAALTTAHTAAANRERLLRDYLDYRRTAVDLGDAEVNTYVLHSAHDPAMARRLAGTLVLSGIEVYRADEPVSVGGRTLPAGATYLVPLSQPTARQVRQLLDPHVEMDPEFLQRQRERMARRLDHEMYDVSAWSMPLLFDVEAIASSTSLDVASTRIDGSGADLVGLGTSMVSNLSAPVLPDARVGYLLPWGTATAAAVVEALHEGIRVHVLGDGFTLEGREYPIGTALIRTAELWPGDRETLAGIVARHGAEAVPTQSGYVEDGISLGSNQVEALKSPRVVVAWDEPTRSYSAGWARYVLERRYGQDVSAIRANTLTRAQLSDYDVIVLPSGDYSEAFNDGFLDRLRGWMRDGGTLISMATSSAWAAEVGLLETGPELRGGKPANGDDGESEGVSGSASDQPINYLDAIEPDEEDPITIPGAILNGVLDTTHWLSSGTDGRIGVLVEGDRIFTPITLDHGTNVGRYGQGDDLVASGIVWEQSRDQLMNKAFLVHQPVGRGHLIAFAEEPNYRAYTEATALLFMNAVLMGPAF